MRLRYGQTTRESDEPGYVDVVGHVSVDRLDRWLRGEMLIQSAFPDMDRAVREFLISGTSPEGWKQTFPPDEED